MTTPELTDEEIIALKPSYQCSFPAKRHPDTTKVTSAVRTYLAEKWPWPSEGVREKYLRLGLEYACPLFLPRARADLLEPASLWFTIYFLVDDIMEEVADKGLEQKLFRIFPLSLGTANPTKGDAFEEVIYDIHKRCREAGNEADKRAFLEMTEDTIKWMKYVLQKRREVTLAPPTFQDVDEYYQHRIGDVGAFVFFPMLAWTNTIHIPENVRKHTTLQALEAVVSKHGVYINDLYSLRKDLKEVERTKQRNVKAICPSLLLFMKEAEGLRMQEVLVRVTQELTRLEEEFRNHSIKATSSIRQDFGEDVAKLVERYIQDLELFIGGNVAWHGGVGRYNDVESFSSSQLM